MNFSQGRCGVIFDMDGVLVDSYRPHFESWHRSARQWGLEMTEEQFRSTFGMTSREIVVALWGDRLPQKDVPAFDELKEHEYRRIILQDFPAMPGAKELIVSLHQAGFKLAVGSSGPPENVKLVLECLGAVDLFEATVSGAEVKHGKPDPEVFLKAAGKLELAPGECLVIEDAVPGVSAALAAGMAVAAVTGTATRDQLARANMVVDSLKELTPAIVGELIGSGSRR
jgi:beta-phosphoglucomutase